MTAAAVPARRRLLTPTLRAFLAAVLLVTGVTKLLDVTGFAAIVATYRAVPGALLVPAAWLVTLGELGLAAWLASGLALRSAALASAALHAIYVAWTATALARGLRIENCGCFGVFWGRPLTITTLVEDGALVLLSLLLARAAGRA